MRETGFIYQAISAAAQCMTLIVLVVCADRLLTGRDDRLSQRKRTILWSGILCLLTCAKCLLPVPGWFLSIGNPLCISLCCVLMLTYFYSDKAWVKVAHVSMLILQNVLADFIFIVVFGLPSEVNDWANAYYLRHIAERTMEIALVSILLNIIYTIAVMRVWKKKRVKISPVWLAMMLQSIVLFIVIRVMRGGETSAESAGHFSYFVFISMFTLLEFAMVMLYLSQLEKREAEHKVEELQIVRGVEKAHYEQIEERREEMESLRRDYDTILTSVMNLLEGGKTAEAETVLQDLSVRISATREYPFCPIPIINAILTEKQKICEAEDITFSVELMLPDTVGVADLDLCMIFGNLMDNAIRACREVNEKGKTGGIALQGGMVQEYLIIKCKNTALENRENKIWGTGYGHKILTDIAGKYHGDFQTIYEDGNFVAQISLNVTSEIGR
ncbi:MAG TPA: hypothetical protein DCZ20_11335 [Lachnospiraceae bacterium]|nr:hypothetical protein [Lachnospiraceae bacterium]